MILATNAWTAIAAVNDLRALPASHLATLAGVHQPAGSDTPGARFLTDVRDYLSDCLSYDDEPIDERRIEELATDASHGPTHLVWEAVAELRLYREETTDVLGGTIKTRGMTAHLRDVQFLVAERLIRELLKRAEEVAAQ